MPRRIAYAGEKEEVPESQTETKVEPAKIADAEYHEVADQYLNSLQLAAEEAAESDAAKGLEVEFSAGVMTISHPSKGEYVINKQPPNKQIWLSSPVSGPKRYDWVVVSQSSQDSMNAKQDTEGSTGALGDDGSLGGGRWIYLRDGSSLTELLKDELEIIIPGPDGPDATAGREGPGASGVGGGTGATSGIDG